MIDRMKDFLVVVILILCLRGTFTQVRGFFLIDKHGIGIRGVQCKRLLCTYIMILVGLLQITVIILFL